MAHMLDKSTGDYAIAYAGETPWHRHGTPAQAGWTLEDWITNAHIDYEAERVPAFALIDGSYVPVDGAFFNARSDTRTLLGAQTHTDRRIEVQPREIARFVHDYVSVDDRFKMEVMGAIKGGTQIWATAGFNGDMDVAGEKHRAYLLARTSFDGSTGTVLQMTMTRAVCNNTLSLAYADKAAMVTIRHTQTFDHGQAAAQLAQLAQSVAGYKAIGDALAQNAMAEQEVVQLFKQLLAIPADAKREDVSTRKLNVLNALAQSYEKSVAEGAERATAWSALQAVTRYADHSRTARGDEGDEDHKRFLSSQFGSGDQFKGQAMQLLMPRIRDMVAA